MATGRTKKIAMLCAVTIGLVAAPAVFAEKTIGRWCDRMIPNMPKYNHIMTIVETDDGKCVLRSKFGDGSSSTSQLIRQDERTFAQVDSASGDKYRIEATTRKLELLDRDGLIRVATPLGNTPRSGECK